MIVVYLHFETTGLDVMEHNIVEIALVEHSSSTIFSTVVCPPKFETNTVHGISDDELKRGPTFTVAFDRMVSFLNNLAGKGGSNQRHRSQTVADPHASLCV